MESVHYPLSLCLSSRRSSLLFAILPLENDLVPWGRYDLQVVSEVFVLPISNVIQSPLDTRLAICLISERIFPF